MKLYRFLIITLAFTAIAVSCRDAEPNIPFNVFNHGAYARTVSITSGTYNFFDLPSSAFTATIQIVDERDGDLLQSVDVYVRHRRGQTLSTEALVKTLTASAFTKTPAAPQPGTATPTGREDGKSGRSYPQATFSVTATEAADATGPTLANVDPGDIYEIRLVLNLTDGRSFSNNNASADIQGGPFYASPFFYRSTVVCDIPATLFVGNYQMVQSGATPGAFGGSVFEASGSQVVTLTRVSGTVRSFDATYFAALGFGNERTFQFNLVCGDIVFRPDQPAGLGCSAIGLALGTADTAGTFNAGDDSVFTLTLKDNVRGDCGSPSPDVTFTFTKQ